MGSNTAPRSANRGERGARLGVVWLCSIIQYQKIIQMGGNLGPTEFGLVFLPSAGGLFGESSSGLESPAPGTPGLGTPHLAAIRDRGHQVGFSGCRDASRPRGGRPAPVWNVLSGSESHKLLLRFFKRSRKDTFRSFVRHLGP